MFNCIVMHTHLPQSSVLPVLCIIASSSHVGPHCCKLHMQALLIHIDAQQDGAKVFLGYNCWHTCATSIMPATCNLAMPESHMSLCQVLTARCMMFAYLQLHFVHFGKTCYKD